MEYYNQYNSKIKIKKIKEWKATKDQQFVKIREGSAQRILDGAYFQSGRAYNFGFAHKRACIDEFMSDLIHVSYAIYEPIEHSVHKFKITSVGECEINDFLTVRMVPDYEAWKKL